MEPERFATSIYAHEPIYLLVGGKPEVDAKLQFSFKVHLVKRVYLGYTQLSLWDIARDSAPFRDYSHRPSLFWYQRLPDAKDALWFHTSAGWEHNSNGKDGPDSRSIDTLFFKGVGTYGDDAGAHTRTSVKVFAYLNKGSQNSDIANYRRWFELETTLTNPSTFSASLTYRHGRSGKGNAQVDLSYAARELGSFFACVPGFVSLQVFKGYGETLAEYNVRKPTQYRVGYVFERANGRSDTQLFRKQGCA